MFRELDGAVLENILSGTPSKITPEILDLCDRIVAGGTPEFVAHVPARGAIVRECFPNVTAHVRAEGGSLVYGWAIWEWPGVFIEAEHHAVWKSPNGLIDITPHEYTTNGVLFLADPTATYDFDGFSRRNNIKRATTDFPAVAEYLDISDLMFRTLEDASVGKEYRLSHGDLFRLQAMEDRKTQLKANIYFHLAEGKRPNDVCFCQSGIKFKKCCSRYFR